MGVRSPGGYAAAHACLQEAHGRLRAGDYRDQLPPTMLEVAEAYKEIPRNGDWTFGRALLRSCVALCSSVAASDFADLLRAQCWRCGAAGARSPRVRCAALRCSERERERLKRSSQLSAACSHSC